MSVIKDITNDAVEWLNSLCWHDSILYEIRFIRTNSADEVHLLLDLIDRYEPVSTRKASLIFGDCRLIESRMKWGVICISGGEQIDRAECSEKGELTERTRKTWSQVGVEVENIAQFSLVMASTGSTLDIVFGKMEMIYTDSEIDAGKLDKGH